MLHDKDPLAPTLDPQTRTDPHTHTRANPHHLLPLQGLGTFTGKVLHAKDFRLTGDLLRGKRVLVLGAGKSALDCSVVAAAPDAGAASVTTLFRQVGVSRTACTMRERGSGPHAAWWRRRRPASPRCSDRWA